MTVLNVITQGVKQRRLFRLLLTCGVLILSFCPLSYAAEDAENQALEQLRMLQNQMKPSGDKGKSNNSDNKAQGEPKDSKPAQKPPNRARRPAPTRPNTRPQQGGAAVETEEAREAIKATAFKDVLERSFPLDPDQVVTLKQKMKTQEFAEESPVGVPPKPTATSQFVNLSPGSTPPVIRLSQGFVSSLVFLDSTGAPWPITAYDLGNPKAFNITWDKTGNTLMIQASSLYTYGNLAVKLEKLNTPVMLTLIPGQKAVDYRVDLRVQGLGPNAKMMPVTDGLPSSANDVLLRILEGIPPPHSKRLQVSGGDARAWLWNNKMLIRTNLTILSPAWLAIMTSADGMHAYEMQKSPVLLVSWHGKVMQLKIEGL